jgi:hypothetical protein
MGLTGMKYRFLTSFHCETLKILSLGSKRLFVKKTNPKVLAFDFTEKCRFVAKTYQNFVFLGYKAHILDRLYIMVMYIGFYQFKKIKIWLKMQRW